MGEPMRQRLVAVAVAVALVGVLAIAVTMTDATTAVVMGAVAIAGLQLVRVPAPSGDYHYLGVAAVVALPLMTMDWWAIAGAFAGGMIASGLVVLVRSSDQREMERQVPTEAIGTAAFPGVRLGARDDSRLVRGWRFRGHHRVAHGCVRLVRVASVPPERSRWRRAGTVAALSVAACARRLAGCPFDVHCRGPLRLRVARDEMVGLPCCTTAVCVRTPLRSFATTGPG